jgi:hypothetical protein
LLSDLRPFPAGTVQNADRPLGIILV